MKEYTIKVYKDRTEWLLNGKLHREDDNGVQLPAIEMTGGTKFWYKHGKLHREDGPAMEYSSGFKSWYLNGELHREDGPAVVWKDERFQWYLNGKEVKRKDVMGPIKKVTLAEAEELLGYTVEIDRHLKK